MVNYKSKKNIKSKASRKKTIKKTRKRIYKIKGGEIEKGDCGLYFKNYYDVLGFRDYVLTNDQIRGDKIKDLGEFEANQGCLDQIRVNYIM